MRARQPDVQGYVEHLARHGQVVTFDGPGHGRSDRSTDPTLL